MLFWLVPSYQILRTIPACPIITKKNYHQIREELLGGNAPEDRRYLLLSVKREWNLYCTL